MMSEEEEGKGEWLRIGGVFSPLREVSIGDRSLDFDANFVNVPDFFSPLVLPQNLGAASPRQAITAGTAVGQGQNPSSPPKSRRGRKKKAVTEGEVQQYARKRADRNRELARQNRERKKEYIQYLEQELERTKYELERCQSKLREYESPPREKAEDPNKKFDDLVKGIRRYFVESMISRMESLHKDSSMENLLNNYNSLVKSTKQSLQVFSETIKDILMSLSHRQLFLFLSKDPAEKRSVLSRAYRDKEITMKDLEVLVNTSNLEHCKKMMELDELKELMLDLTNLVLKEVVMVSQCVRKVQSTVNSIDIKVKTVVFMKLTKPVNLSFLQSVHAILENPSRYLQLMPEDTTPLEFPSSDSDIL